MQYQNNHEFLPVPVPQSVPARVSVVLVEETGFRCAGRLASVPVDLDEQMLAEVVCPAGVAECMDGFILPMLAGTVSPSDVAEQVADDTASLADAGIPFPADSAGTLSPPDPAGTVSGSSCWDTVPGRPCWP